MSCRIYGSLLSYLDLTCSWFVVCVVCVNLRGTTWELLHPASGGIAHWHNPFLTLAQLFFSLILGKRVWSKIWRALAEMWRANFLGRTLHMNIYYSTASRRSHLFLIPLNILISALSVFHTTDFSE